MVRNSWHGERGGSDHGMILRMLRDLVGREKRKFNAPQTVSQGRDGKNVFALSISAVRARIFVARAESYAQMLELAA